MGLDKAGIILAAEQNVSRGSELDTIAGTRLDMILDELYENYLSEMLSKNPPATITFAAASQTWTLPSDYLKFMVLTLVRSDLNAANPTNIVLPKIDFSDYQQLSNPLAPGTPQLVSINRIFTDVGGSGCVAYVWPVPNIAYTGRLSYYYKPDYSVSTSTQPTFPDTMLLVELLTNALLGMGYKSSSRQYDPNLIDKLMTRHRRNQADNGIYPQRAKLDGRKFTGASYARTGRFSNWSRD